MNLYALYSAIRDGVAQDAQLAAWAAARFSKNVTVFAGLSGSRMPYPDDDGPFVVLGDPADRRGMEDSTIDYELSGWIGLSCGRMRADSLPNVIEPAGIEQIAQALTLVRDAICAALPGDIVLSNFETAADTLGAGDQVHGYFQAGLLERLTIGQDPLD
ncbi:hypothetical protein [Desulfatitalea tepidiphila]|uniref:hypothetical protein n=1 Tax=Desulfatitalea tepidiphila TaxID=1185843 RepID=UPI0006B69FD3|nr:hypothetical protein [Desulfatitalea tepidiphila]